MRDIRYAIRSLLKTPGLTFTALLTLALGTGATTAIFTVVRSVLLRPLPFSEPDRLVQFEPMGVMDFEAVREQSRSFESMVSYSARNSTLQDTTSPERVAVVAAERGLFELLGARALEGRVFGSADSTDVAVVNAGFWRRFGGRAPLNDVKIVLDGQPYTVIGVMPETFQFPYRPIRTEIWIPMDLPRTSNRFQRIDVAVGRLKGGVTIDAARAELRAIARRLELLYPASGNMPAITIGPLTEAVIGRSRPALLTLSGAVAMVLLIACANVTNLLLARSEARRREVAVRMAIGASRARVMKQFVTESILLTLAGGLGAAAIGQGGTTLLVAIAGAQFPRSVEIGADWTVFLLLLAICVVTGIGFGVVATLRVTKASLSGVLEELDSRSSASRRSVAINNALVGAEIALALVLLIGAGLLLRGFVRLTSVSTGLVADDVLTLRLEARGLIPNQPPVPANSSDATTAEGRYFRAIEEAAMRIPGVRAAGFVTLLPIERPGNLGSFAIAGREAPEPRPAVRMREATPGYFRALGIPLRAGRLFTDRDPGVLVNETFVNQYLAGEDPIGRILDRGTIIGVVGDVRQRLRLPTEPEIYSPLARTSYSAATLVVNAPISRQRLVEQLRAAIRGVNPNQAVYNISTMNQVIATSHLDLNLQLWLIGSFAALALALSMAGIYGVMSYAVARRSKEFGIRLALGADAWRMLRLVLMQGALPIGGGLMIGIAGAFGVTRVLGAQLYEVTPTDPATFAIVTFALAGVAVAACLNPARRAMKLDPLTVLRRD